MTSYGGKLGGLYAMGGILGVMRVPLKWGVVWELCIVAIGWITLTRRGFNE